MEVKRLSSSVQKNPSLPVKCTEMGNVVEIQYMSNRNSKQTIQMLPGGEQFVVCATGEVRDVEHHQTRNDNKKGLYKTFANLRGLINANITDVSKVRWCTLTYAENMTDTKKLYVDFKKFNMRFQYYCEKHGYGNPEYIVMFEPQCRGAWHAHLLYIWTAQNAPFIPNSELADLWGHGFVKITKLDDVDNVGAYLTAYLGDMEVSEMLENHMDISGEMKEISVCSDNGKKESKYFVKGARLTLYPADFKMIRHSKGVKKPVVDMISQEEAYNKVAGYCKTYESTVELSDANSDFKSVICKEYYNKVRKNNSCVQAVGPKRKDDLKNDYT